MNFFKWLFSLSIDSTDPVYHCSVFKNHGCSHVDGFLCNMETCDILKDYKFRELEHQCDIPIKDRYDKNSNS